MRFEFESVSVWTVVKVGFLVNLILGVIGGLFLAVVMFPFMAALPQLGAPGMIDPGMAEMSFGMMVILLPIMYGIGNAIFGTIMFAIAAIVYNLVARIAGGIEYDVKVQNWGELSGFMTSGTAQGYQTAPTPPMGGALSGTHGPYAAPPPSQQKPPEPTPPERTVPQPPPPTQPPEGRPAGPSTPPPPREDPRPSPESAPRRGDDDPERPQL